MKRKLTWDEILGILLFLLAAGLLAVSVFLCFSDDIWYDELFTMGLANQSFGGLVSVTARDVHPPLYYMIAKLFLVLFRPFLTDGTALAVWQAPVVAVKLASVLPFFLCLLYGITKVRRHFGLLAAGLFGFLMLAMPQLGGYTVEMRMYGYGLFFITAGMLHAFELAQAGEEGDGGANVSRNRTGKDAGRGSSKRNLPGWTALTLYALAACYTHYFACVAAMMVYAYLFFALWKGQGSRRGSRRGSRHGSRREPGQGTGQRSGQRPGEEWERFWLSGGVCALGYLPWILWAVRGQVGQVKESYWIQPVTWRTLGGCVKFVFQPAFSDERLNAILAVVLAVICVVLLGQALAKLPKEKGEHGRIFFVFGCLGVLAGLVLFGFAASLLIRPIFVYRYMLPALPLFWLALAILLSGWKEKKAVFLSLFVLLLVIGLRNYRAFYGEEMWKRVQMADAREALSQIQEEDAVVFNFDQTQGVVTFYLPNDTWLWYGKPEELIVEMYPQNHSLVEGEFSDEAGIAALRELLGEYERVWFCGSGNAREEILEKWENAGLAAQEKASVMVERYWFNLYLLKSKSTE